MNWIETPESSNISRFKYDETNSVLAIEFKDGSQYQYFDVSSTVFEQMQSAASKGQFLAQSIKGKYRYARV